MTISERTAAGVRAVVRGWGFAFSGVAGLTGEVLVRVRNGHTETLHLPTELDSMSGKERAALLERFARDHGETIHDDS